MNPLVSCVVPVYNGERYLAETLESIFEQMYKPIEIIIVDDGSTDGTPSIVETYGDRVRYIKKEHSGIAATCNAGVRAAQGEFISFLDSDDLWLPAKTEKQMDMLAAVPEAGASISLIQNFWMPELRDEENALRNHRQAQPMEGYVLHVLLVRRDTLHTVGFFDESLYHAGKTAWFLEAERLGVRIELLREVLGLRRMHPGNFSRQHAARSQMEYLRVLKKYRDLGRAKQK